MQKLNGFFRIIFALSMILIAIFSTIVSTGLTIYSFERVTDGIQNKIIIGGFFVLMQIMVLLGGLSLGFISKYCPQHYKFILTFTKIAFVLSVLSTVTYFSILDITERKKVIEELLKLFPFLLGDFKVWLIGILTNLTLIWLSCVMLDLMAMKFPNVGIDLLLKNNIVTKVKTEKSFFGKLFYIVTAGVVNKVNTKYAVKKFEVETDEKETKEEIEQAKNEIFEKEKQEKNDIDVNDESDHNDKLSKNDVDENVVKFPEINKTEDTKEDEEPIFTLEEKEIYINFIVENRKDNMIPTNREVIEHFEDVENVFFNPRKISKIREDLYKNNILIKPENFNSRTFFTDEFYKTIVDIEPNINTDIKN